MTDHRFWADVVAGVHVGFVGFVLIGFVLTLLAWCFQWRCARDRWFRFAHIAAIVYTAVRASLGAPCPLTLLETWLRKTSPGIDVPAGDWVRWSHRLVFKGADHRQFTACVIVLAIIALADFLWTYRWPIRDEN